MDIPLKTAFVAFSRFCRLCFHCHFSQDILKFPLISTPQATDAKMMLEIKPVHQTEKKCYLFLFFWLESEKVISHGILKVLRIQH